MAGKVVFDLPSVTLAIDQRPTASRVSQSLATTSPEPFPVIVGCPRSGTSLLAVMLDAHPELAVPPETSFLGLIASLRGEGAALRQRTFEIMTADRITISNWSDFGLDKDELRRRLEAIEPFDLGAGVRAFYSLYAERERKPRVGEKTPGYIFAMPQIAALLPEARFIHVIRDPRDTALSWRKTWFAPSQDFAVLGLAWKTNVEAGRRAGTMLQHYMEIRYEDLVTRSEPTLRRVCAFLSLAFTSSMLDYCAHGETRIARLQGRSLPDGRMVSREQRARIHANLAQPPLSDRIDVWRREMSDADRRRLEQAVGPLVHELGYSA